MAKQTVTFENRGVAKCPYSVTLEYVSDYMGRFASGAADTIVMLPYRALGLPVRGGLRHRVSIEFTVIDDQNTRSRSHQALEFHWYATAAFLPNLHGVLGFRIAGDGLTELVLKCAYDPPFGFVGAVFDRVLGKRVAIFTGQALLDRIIADVEARELVFRAGFPLLAPR